MQTDAEIPPAQAAALAELCDRAVAKALELEQPDAFLSWMQEQADTAELAVLELEGEDLRRMLYWLGRSIWDALPQPEHHFKARPLPPVRRNDPCPCGSGRKFKKCCAPMQSQVPEPLDEAVQRVVAASLDASQRQALAADHQAPLSLKLAVAEHLAEEAGFEGVPDLLLPVFESLPARGGMDVLLPALDLLMEALDEQRREPEATLLTVRLADEDRGPLAGYGNARIGAVALIAGDPEEALRRARMALKADRSDPRPALLEITALVAMDRVGEARASAAHWHREALVHWPEETDFIQRMARYEADPQQAHPDHFDELPEGLRRLQAVVASLSAEPLPRLVLEPAPAREGAPQPGPPGLAVTPADAAVKTAEARWLAWLDIELEFEPEALAGWLEENPAALDSPVVLEAMALIIEDQLDPESVAFADSVDEVVAPLLTRLRDIALDVLAHLPEGHELPRQVPANRVVLHALADHARAGFDEAPDPEEAVALLRRLLELDPEGALGHAGHLAEMLLHLERPQEALELAESFPREDSPALAYGRVLALYRLDRRDQAATALAEAAAVFPNVLDELLAEDDLPDNPFEDVDFENLEREKLAQEGWIYALRMGTEYAETPGLLDWLRRHHPGGSEG